MQRILEWFLGQNAVVPEPKRNTVDTIIEETKAKANEACNSGVLLGNLLPDALSVLAKEKHVMNNLPPLDHITTKKMKRRLFIISDSTLAMGSEKSPSKK